MIRSDNISKKYLEYIGNIENIGRCDGIVMARPNSEHKREQSETATIHVANTMMTNDTVSYVAISAYSDIEIAQQYDCRFSKSFGVWNTTCYKSDLSHHQMSLKLVHRH